MDLNLSFCLEKYFRQHVNKDDGIGKHIVDRTFYNVNKGCKLMSDYWLFSIFSQITK